MFCTISNPAPAISIKNAFLAFRQAIIFKNLNLTLHAARWTSLLGPSGAGKSTLLRLIANLSSPDTTMQAEVTVNNAIPLAEQISYMAQSDLLLPWLTVLDNVLLSLRLRHHTPAQKKQLTEHAKYLLEKTGLQKSEKLFPRHLSGGMRQRVALVRTLLENKMIVLMDEPFSALDAMNRYYLQNLAVELLKKRTVIFVTHDPLEALRVSDEIIVMSGQPATLSTPLTLIQKTPREISSPELLSMQAKLYIELNRAHEETA